MRQNLLIFLFLIAFSAIVAQTRKSPVRNNAPLRSTTFTDTTVIRTYQLNFTIPDILFLDSVLNRARNTTGYKLYAEDADNMRNGLDMIINFVRQQVKVQTAQMDSADYRRKLKK